MSFQHVMLDLETLGTRAGCAILSIGAVKFNPARMEFGDDFYRVVDLQSCLSAGLKVEASTLKWWLRQEDQACAAISGEGLPLVAALRQFQSFLDGSLYLWSHGASFDVPVLETAYFAAKATNVPWDFRNVRDTRTIFDLTGTRIRREGSIKHHALDDAKAQAVAVIEAYGKLRSGGVV